MLAVHRFATLVLALSAPFWVLDAVLASASDQLPIALPLSALAAVTPMVAAWILTARDEGGAAVRAWLGRAADLGHAPLAWLAVAVVGWPAVLALAAVVQLWTGVDLPPIRAELGTVAVMAVVFGVGGFTEELGWQGYAWPRMVGSRDERAVAFELGVFWAVWHIVPYVQTGHDVAWVAWHCLVTVLLRVMTVWLFVNGGRSVALVAVFHAFCNLAYFLYPAYGSHYDPRLTFLVLVPVVGAMLLRWRVRSA